MQQKKVFILGVEGFPAGGARIEKLKLIGMSLLATGISVHFISNTWSRFKENELPEKGEINGITYHYSSGITYRPSSFLKRRFVKLKGQFNEITFLLFNNCDAVIVSVISGMFFPILKYWIISRIKGYKIYYPHHEEESTLRDGNFFHKLNLFFFKKFVWKLLDGAFPITTFLNKKIKGKNPKLPTIIIPAMVDFDVFREKQEFLEELDCKYFMYCGSYYYFDVILFIIESFERIENIEYQLHLVCSGDDEKKQALEYRIQNSRKSDLINLFDFLSYEELINKYQNASALLIPLKETISDIARFPHKVGEYTASKNPILSMPVGDMSLYFNNFENIIFAKSYNVEDYADAMKFIITNRDKSVEIGQNGFETGLLYFNYLVYGKKLKEFMNL